MTILYHETNPVYTIFKTLLTQIKLHQRHRNAYTKYQPLPVLPGSHSKRMDQHQKPSAQMLHVSCFQTGGRFISDGLTVLSCRLQEKPEV